MNNKLSSAVGTVRAVFVNTCVTFTLTTLALTVFSYTLKQSSATSYSYFLYILLFSFMFSLSTLIFKIKSLPGAAVRIVHFILTYCSFAVSFFLIGQIINTSRTILFVSVGFIPLYIIVSVIAVLLRRLGGALSGGRERYDRQFDNVK